MRRLIDACVLLIATALAATWHAVPAELGAQGASAAFTFEQVAGYPFPTELAAAEQAGRIAWAFNEQGRRNIWAAEAPAFSPRRLTAYDLDDGQELTSVALSPAGDRIVYVRGGDHGTNWDGGLPVNASSSPVPPKVCVWSVPFQGGDPVLLAEGDAPVISPRGDLVAFERDRQIWIVPIDGAQPARRALASSGTNGNVVWAPDGNRFAFVSNRGDHAFIGIYRDEGAPILWLAPATSRDSSPRWSPDGSRLVFVRRPGAGGPPAPTLERRHNPWSLWIADAETGEGRELWKAPETLRGSWPTTHGNANLHWAAKDRIVFLSYIDGWPHLYSMIASGGAPVLLTPGAYMAEHIRLSPDRSYLVFSANAGATPDDIDRRHIVRVPVDRAEPEVLTSGQGIEWSPVVAGGSGHLAFIGATAQRPPLPMVRPPAGGAPSVLAADRVPADFPADRLVTPKAVTFKVSDGLTVHAQLFEAPASGTRRPAVIYVHGGPPRQMLLGWHYSDYYARAYATNQYLASRGFVVLSLNYRLGIGYGYEFHQPPAAGPAGASEYLDVKAAAQYLRALVHVDPKRIGIYGGSYGGYLTALALARNSDLFAAGVDIHGVHDWTEHSQAAGRAAQAMSGSARFEKNDREEALKVAWYSSPVSAIASWKSPVLLIHGDEDRNVRFGQTADLARRLSAAGISFDELVIPDDTHHWMRNTNALRVGKATAAFLERTLRP